VVYLVARAYHAIPAFNERFVHFSSARPWPYFFSIGTKKRTHALVAEVMVGSEEDVHKSYSLRIVVLDEVEQTDLYQKIKSSASKKEANVLMPLQVKNTFISAV
jgi:hypothetical protein